MKNKIGFVILHYNDYEVTSKCVDSILNLDEQDRIEIVIVDNNSQNDSGTRLQANYGKNSEKIGILLLDKNYGFSRANNIGYEYLLKTGNQFDFIFIANNDIIFCQKNMISLLEEQYQQEKFYLAGPDVWAVYKKEHQNPLSLSPRTKEEIQDWIVLNKRKLRMVEFETILHGIWTIVNDTKLYKMYRKMIEKNMKDSFVREYAEKANNVVLTGACLIFSKDFIEYKIKPFNPETYFYHEEDILTTRCLMNKWKISYLPELQVDHLEGVVTKQKGYYKRMKFRYKNFVNSGTIYLEYLNKQADKNFADRGK